MRPCAGNNRKATADDMAYPFAFDYVQCKWPEEDQIEGLGTWHFLHHSRLVICSDWDKTSLDQCETPDKVTELRPVT